MATKHYQLGHDLGTLTVEHRFLGQDVRLLIDGRELDVIPSGSYTAREYLLGAHVLKFALPTAANWTPPLIVPLAELDGVPLHGSAEHPATMVKAAGVLLLVLALLRPLIALVSAGYVLVPKEYHSLADVPEPPDPNVLLGEIRVAATYGIFYAAAGYVAFRGYFLGFAAACGIAIYERISDGPTPIFAQFMYTWLTISLVWYVFSWIGFRRRLAVATSKGHQR